MILPPSNLPSLWKHQGRGAEKVLRHIAEGVMRILLVSPTGGGKTRMAIWLILRLLAERGWPAIVYTNRKLLVEQLEKSFLEHGITPGIRAAGRQEDNALKVQISSVQTEASRVYRRKDYKKWELFPAKVAFFDEAHLQSNKTGIQLMNDHVAAGCVVILLTATPLDMAPGLAQVLVQAGVNSELRECGALVPAWHYGIEEPDLGAIRRTEFNKSEDLSEAETREVMGKVGEDGTPSFKLQNLFGRVIDTYRKLNPDNKPSILFAPGVPESRWFAEEFTKAGIPAGHIDGDDIWVPGCETKSDRNSRNELLAMSRDGHIKVLCNRFVLREGIDCTWLAHGIFATPFGSLQTYLQSGGRLLRAHPGMDRVTIQDHGGNGWRHDSLNLDRHWELDQQSRVIAGVRAERLRQGLEKEPNLCPVCKLMLRGLKCPCGFTIDIRKKTRPVIMSDGELVLMKGEYFTPRRTVKLDDTQEKWDSLYWRMKKKKAGKDFNFRQLYGLFFQKHRYFPPWTLNNMPKSMQMQWRMIKGTTANDLIQPPEAA